MKYNDIRRCVKTKYEQKGDFIDGYSIYRKNYATFGEVQHHELDKFELFNFCETVKSVVCRSIWNCLKFCEQIIFCSKIMLDESGGFLVSHYWNVYFVLSSRTP